MEKTSCAYGPEARVLKNITTKEHEYTNTTIDSALVASILQEGSVNFSKSDTKRDSCKLYIIEATLDAKDYELVIENCEKAKIISIK